ncbi:putative minor fimbrial subunit StfE [Serratia grimesii]|uniref:fimbrial protein n=1 Tax=Serratia grimesii TaxID=82995 RepID=UPI0021C50425|nr:fimbrial protein [Serratia grimesii]CAI2790836.1 putative minor fimbrial subunit StfE [Serratia grimesii]
MTEGLAVRRFRLLGRHNVLLITLVTLPGTHTGPAAKDLSNITMSITGTVIESAPCKINGGNTIDVYFGEDLLTTRIDGVNYRKPVNYTLDCTNAGNRAIRMQIQGLSATFDSRVLATTERRDLGIALRLTAGDAGWPINSWMQLDSSMTAPALQAVPVKALGSQLTAGRFSAGATLVVDYQ